MGQNSQSVNSELPIRFTCGIVTEHVRACADFYMRYFGMKIVHDHEWYVQLRSWDHRFEIAFVQPHRAEVTAEFHAPFAGEGMFLGLEHPDLESILARLASDGIAIITPLRDEPWGERRFAVRDPAGIVVNVWCRSKTTL